MTFNSHMVTIRYSHMTFGPRKVVFRFQHTLDMILSGVR